MAARIRRGLDAGAMAWLRLMADPCNAPLTTGCYQGTSSGMLYRTRVNVSVGASAVDSSCWFIPSNDQNSTGYYPIQWASVNTTGTNPTTLYGTAIPGVPSGAQVRCVAACIKIRYTGSELNRAGIVGHHLTRDAPFLNGYPAGSTTTTYTVAQMQTTAQTLYRLGESDHEVRWVPSFEDGTYVNNGPGTGLAGSRTGNAVALSVQGAPAGSIYYEVTAVWEVIPPPVGGLIPPEQPPRSSNTLNDVLRVVGNIGKFATDPHNRETVMNVVRTAVGAGRVLASSFAPSVAGLLTY